MYEPWDKLMRAGHARSVATFGPGSASRRPRRSARRVIASVAGIAIVASAGMANLSTASAATVTGTMVTNNLTRPGGGAFLPGGGGHFWVSDGVLRLLGIWREVQSTPSREDPHGRRRSQRSAPRVQGELNQVNRRL